jgi:malonate-semialdehyde dehydrogenase (acetylating)/methylmalonate-semialdehyde dehydrogenase
LDLPKGVINMVHGGKASVDELLENPLVKSISFVGSTAVAKYIYSKGTANGKRVQAQGGAKNPVVILPDADIEMTSQIITDSVFGCAGQRCLAASVVITVEENSKIKESLYEAARSRTVGYGMHTGIEMGPVISNDSKVRIESLIDQGVAEGGSLLLDGRNKKVGGFETGNFVIFLEIR